MSRESGLRVWDVYARVLMEEGLHYVSGMVSDGNGLLEALQRVRDRAGLTLFTARDQRVAVASAVGYAQVVREPVIYVASPGPGLANGLGGILEAWSLALPMLVISNGVSTSQRENGAFQDLDAINLIRPVTKWQYRVERPDRAVWALLRSLQIAVNGKPGPVYLEIPDDLGPIAYSPEGERLNIGPMRSQASPDAIRQAAAALTRAERPVTVVGGGCWNGSTEPELVGLAMEQQAAIFATASGRGVIDENHSHYCGLVGLYACPPADELLREADLYLLVGTQVEETAMMGWAAATRHKPIIQIDVSAETIGRTLSTRYGLVGDAALTLRALREDARTIVRQSNGRDPWIRSIADTKQALTKRWSQAEYRTSPVRSLLSELQSVFGSDLILVQENGLHDMWGYFFPVYTVHHPGRTVGPGEQTMLGLGMGSSIGVKLARPEAPVVAVVGDGAFQMGDSAVFTAAELSLGITFVVLDNGGFAWPRLQQARRGEEIGTTFSKGTDWTQVARDVDGFSAHPSGHDELRVALSEARNANALGRVAVIQLDVPWDRDIPIGVRLHYGSPESDQ